MPIVAATRAPSSCGWVTATILIASASIKPLHALAHGRLGEPDRGADLAVGPAAVLLELLDDPQVEVVDPRSVLIVGTPGHQAFASGGTRIEKWP